MLCTSVEWNYVNCEIPIFITSPQGIWIVKLSSIDIQVTINVLFIIR